MCFASFGDHNSENITITKCIWFISLFHFTILYVRHFRYTDLYGVALICILYIQLMTRAIRHLSRAELSTPPVARLPSRVPIRCSAVLIPSSWCIRVHTKAMDTSRSLPANAGNDPFSSASLLTKVTLFIMCRFYWVVSREMNRSE